MARTDAVAKTRRESRRGRPKTKKLRPGPTREKAEPFAENMATNTPVPPQRNFRIQTGTYGAGSVGKLIDSRKLGRDGRPTSAEGPTTAMGRLSIRARGIGRDGLLAADGQIEPANLPAPFAGVAAT